MLNLVDLKNLKPGPEAAPQKNNAHIHLPPNFSAFDAVDDALDAAKGEGVRLLGASNYYDYNVYSPFVRGALDRRIYPLLGMEIIAWDDGLARTGVKVNDPGNPGKFYICGKGIVGAAKPRPEAQRTLSRIREGDVRRSAVMIAIIEEALSRNGLATGLTEQTVIQKVVQRHGVNAEWVVLQERHIAMAFQQELFEKYGVEERSEKLKQAFGAALKDPESPTGIQNELRSRLMKAGKPCYVEERFISVEEALELIRNLGGLPCYPTLADGASPICGYEQTPEQLVANVKAAGIRTAEFIPGRNDPAVLREYAVKMRQNGIVVGAGTEHNTLDRIAVEPKCLGGQPIPDECRAIFWEAACVFAAHQHRALNGKPGLEQLEPFDEETIQIFAQEGAQLIGGLGNG